MKGGLHIHNAGFAEGTNDCTSGFVIRRWKDGSWPLAILTAGHCVAHGVNEWWEHNNLPLGKSKYQTWGSTAIDGQVRSSDVGVIEIYDVNGSIPATANQLFVYNGSNHIFSIPTYIPTSNQTTGSQACAYGFNSNSSHCVTILKTNVKHSSPSWGVTHWIMNTIEYDWNLIEGDSGGPIYQQWGDDRAAMGTHVHSTSGGGSTGYGWYTPILVGQADYNNVTTAQGNPDSFVLCMDANC